MTTKQKRPPPRPRTTVPLTGTTQAAKAYLDHRSAFGAAFAQAWLHRAGSPKVPVSGVIRRALQLYLGHLSRPDVDPAEEVRAVRASCVASLVDAEAREAAWKRLEEAAEGHGMPSWLEVLYGPQEAARWASLENRVDELLKGVTQ